MTKEDLQKYKMHPDNIRLITGCNTDLYVFTHERINLVIQNELEKFAEWSDLNLWIETDNKKMIQSYLNQPK